MHQREKEKIYVWRGDSAKDFIISSQVSSAKQHADAGCQTFLIPGGFQDQKAT